MPGRVLPLHAQHVPDAALHAQQLAHLLPPAAWHLHRTAPVFSRHLSPPQAATGAATASPPGEAGDRPPRRLKKSEEDTEDCSEDTNSQEEEEEVAEEDLRPPQRFGRLHSPGRDFPPRRPPNFSVAALSATLVRREPGRCRRMNR